MKLSKLLMTAAAVSLVGAVPVGADSNPSAMSSGLVLPRMDSAEGRELFVSKGCVVCHSINGVGGVDAPMLDAEFMDLPMSPFDFAARMWMGAEAMVELQRDELGDVIYLDGEELAAIIAFVHDAGEQAMFSDDEIPPEIEAMMAHADDDDAHADDEEDDGHDDEEADDGHDDEEEADDGHDDEEETEDNHDDEEEEDDHS